MADLEAVQLDDRELFQSAMENDPAPADETPERPRDDLGRFAPKAEAEIAPAEVPKVEAKPETAAPPVETTERPKEDTEGSIPPWRLREMREERDAARSEAEQARRERIELQSRLAKLETPKAEPVDFFADPDQALNQRLDPIKSDFEKFKGELRLEMSKELAVIKYGQPAVTEMESAIEKAMQSNHPDVPALAARMRTSNNPAAVAMDWHKNQKLLTETGGDLTAYKAKVRDEALKDPEFMAKVMEAARAQAGSAAGRPAINLPPSLSRASGSAPSAADDEADMSDRALFKHATASGRR